MHLVAELRYNIRMDMGIPHNHYFYPAYCLGKSMSRNNIEVVLKSR